MLIDDAINIYPRPIDEFIIYRVHMSSTLSQTLRTQGWGVGAVVEKDGINQSRLLKTNSRSLF